MGADRVSAISKLFEREQHTSRIITDAKGQPIERPEPPPLAATIEDKIRWLRDTHAHLDLINDIANRAFTRGLKGIES